MIAELFVLNSTGVNDVYAFAFGLVFVDVLPSLYYPALDTVMAFVSPPFTGRAWQLVRLAVDTAELAGSGALMLVAAPLFLGVAVGALECSSSNR